MIVEGTDNVPLHFQAEDRINPNPAIPTFAWRGASGFYFVGLEVVGLDDVLLWEGDTAQITALTLDSPATLGVTAAGTVQNITVSMERLLSLLPEGTRCWYFRLRVFSTLPTSFVADSEDEPTNPPVGFVWLDFASGQVYEWNGLGWADIGPEIGQNWYVLDTGVWYNYSAGGWHGLAEAPRPGDGEGGSDTCRTYPYRLRHCNEPVLHFKSVQDGVDCIGYNHFDLASLYEMDAIEGITFIDYFFGDEALEDHLDMPIGTTALVSSIPNPVILTANGWEWINPGPNVGDIFLIMNTYGTAVAADVYELTAWVAFVGYWAADGVLTDHFPGAVFDPTMTPAAEGYQHDFKVKGAIEVDALPIEITTTRNGRRTGSSLSSSARMRTNGLPERVARRIQVVMATDGYTINGTTWDTVDNIRRNNETGALWWLDSVLTRKDCEQKVPC